MTTSHPGAKGPSPTRRFENWGRTHASTPARWESPETEAEVQAIVRRAAADGLVVRVVGAGPGSRSRLQAERYLTDFKRFIVDRP